MKRYCIMIGLLLLPLLWIACERVETEPKDWIKDELVWDEADRNATLAQWFLNDVYSYLPTGFNRIGGRIANSSGTTQFLVGDFLDAASGDAVPSRNNTPIENYTNGQVSVLVNPDPYWGTSYAGIRRATIFLANIDRVPATPASITAWKAEARFIRAQLYFELLKRYGGIPLLGNRLFTIDDDLALPRNTYAECVNYIVEECNAIKDSLGAEPIADNGWGRIPRGAALALKGRVLLYAASPLFNGGGVEADPNKRALTGYPAYDAGRWQKAIEAAEELIGLNYYALQSNFANVFTAKKNTEVILAKQAANNFSLEANNAPSGYATPALSLGLTSPTQNLVDAFPMINGLSIDNPASGYDPAKPYANRDPRFDASVFYNGKKWLQRDVETFEGGRDKPGGSAIQTKTGYYLRKFMADFTNNTTYTNQSHNFILFRYAEILLNYAEALNEVGRSEDAIKQIIAIRKRAGIQAGSDARYGVPSDLSQLQLRELIYNERRIELAFEEHRFWDLRRWKIAESVLNGPLYGMKITKNTDGTFSYTRVLVANSVFQPRFYHMPLPYDETLKNLNLVQNEGW